MLKDFTPAEFKEVFALAGIITERVIEHGPENLIFTLTTDTGYPRILISKIRGWWQFIRSVPQDVDSHNNPRIKPFSWVIHGVRKQYPRSTIYTKKITACNFTLSSLRFKVSELDDLEVLIDSVLSVFEVIKNNEEV